MIIETLVNIASQKIFVAAVLAVAICQLIKLVTKSREQKRFYPKGALENGGMPSTHSTGVTVLATIVGLTDGFTSSTFFISAVFAIITMQDAKGLRHNVDTLTKIINKVIKSDKLNLKQLDLITGHTLVQVMAGFCLGLATALVVNFVLFT